MTLVGGINEGEEPEAAARRELTEETSMRSVRVVHAQQDQESELSTEYIDHLGKHVFQRWFLVRAFLNNN